MADGATTRITVRWFVVVVIAMVHGTAGTIGTSARPSSASSSPTIHYYLSYQSCFGWMILPYLSVSNILLFIQSWKSHTILKIYTFLIHTGIMLFFFFFYYPSFFSTFLCDLFTRWLARLSLSLRKKKLCINWRL